MSVRGMFGLGNVCAEAVGIMLVEFNFATFSGDDFFLFIGEKDPRQGGRSTVKERTTVQMGCGSLVSVFNEI